MQVLAELIYVWGMGAAVIGIPTGLVVIWALCRTPSWNARASQSPQVAEPANDAPNVVVDKAA